MSHDVVALKPTAAAVALVLVVACGSSSSATRPSPSPAASPTSTTSASPTSSPAGSPTPQSPSPSPAPVGTYGVLATQGTGDTYTVSLIGVDGRVVATAQPTSPTRVTCGDSAAAVLPLPVSTSNTRAYYLDQQGNVNFLTPNGETGVEYHVPTGGSTRSMFAISPDDSLMALVVVTYTSAGASTKLYMDQLQVGGSQTLLYSESGAYSLWPIGWHGTTNVVVAKVAACTQGGGAFCCSPLELHVIDQATAVRRYTIGGPTCVIAGSPSPAGAVCENKTYDVATILDWTGSQTGGFPIGGPTFAYLSPDGQRVAIVSGSSTAIYRTNMNLALQACGWLDTTHVIAGGDTQQQPRIGDVTTGNIIPVNTQGLCAGVIPGGL